MGPRLGATLVLAIWLAGTAVAQSNVDVGVLKNRGASANPAKALVTAPAGDSTTGRDSSATAEPTDAGVQRETYAYGGASRDPFASLIKTASAGPELSDLQLVAIYEDLRYSRNSIAVLRDKKSGKRYKLRSGEQVGRLRVAQIRPKDVVFTILDFGYERQETLSLRKQEDVAQ